MHYYFLSALLVFAARTICSATMRTTCRPFRRNAAFKFLFRQGCVVCRAVEEGKQSTRSCTSLASLADKTRPERPQPELSISSLSNQHL